MPQLTFDPPLSPAPGFLQTIQLAEGDRTLGTARWHALSEGDPGIVQILDFHVPPDIRRQGNGKRLMSALVSQTLTYHQTRNVTPRRLWISVHQKKHVIARAFLTSQGFVHISTVKDLLQDDDALVYIRTFD